MEYLTPLITFLTGGGLTAIFSIRSRRKISKLDFADRAIEFMENQTRIMEEKVNGLDKRIRSLEKVSCSRPNCKSRLTDLNEINE